MEAILRIHDVTVDTGFWITGEIRQRFGCVNHVGKKADGYDKNKECRVL